MEEDLIPKSESTTKVYQNTLGLSVAPSNPDEFPIVYADNIWDVAENGSKLAELLENIGSFDQHTINELFARILLEGRGGSAGISFDQSFDSSFG